MSKFTCTCGNVISDVQCPNDVTGWLLSEKSGQSFFDSISTIINDYLQHLDSGDVEAWRRKHFNDVYPRDISAGEMIHDALTTRFFDLTLQAMECDACGRLWAQRQPDANDYQGFRPDTSPHPRQKLLGFNLAQQNS